LTIHLMIPDSHAHPDFSNKRYSLLGALIRDVKPDVVIDIGDWWDLPSLCSYDKGTKSFEGRRYKRDIAAGVEAQDRLLSVLRKGKKKLPRFVRTLGNHENRISKAIDRDPVLEGTIGLPDLQSREYHWEEYPFLEPVNVDGINYAHYFTTGVMGRPVSGESPARSLILKQLTSCSMGHVHTFDYHTRTDTTGRRVHGLVGGVYQDYHADFAGPANKLWRRGVVIKHNVNKGDYDLQWVSLDAIERAYRNERF
jgi:hypothetical protein